MTHTILENVSSNGEKPDPVFVSARREAVEILVAWAVCLTWTLSYCALYAYPPPGKQIELVVGIPSWVFWGVAVPWVAASLFTMYYSLARMRLDPLGEEQIRVQEPTGAESGVGQADARTD